MTHIATTIVSKTCAISEIANAIVIQTPMGNKRDIIELSRAVKITYDKFNSDTCQYEGVKIVRAYHKSIRRDTLAKALQVLAGNYLYHASDLCKYVKSTELLDRLTDKKELSKGNIVIYL